MFMRTFAAQVPATSRRGDWSNGPTSRHPPACGVSNTPRLLDSVTDASEYWIARLRGREIYIRPHPEERALARVSKDGRESMRCIHPSRRLLRKLLRMRSVFFTGSFAVSWSGKRRACAVPTAQCELVGTRSLSSGAHSRDPLALPTLLFRIVIAMPHGLASVSKSPSPNTLNPAPTAAPVRTE